jgi:hypothetical protein
MDVQAASRVFHLLTLQVVELAVSSSGRVGGADGSGARGYVAEGCQAPFSAADEELIGLVGLEGVDEGIPGLDLCCGELPDADRESTKSYFMHFRTCIA